MSLGLTGLIDQLWQGILFDGDEFDREAGKRQCRAYLSSVFPWLLNQIAAPATVAKPVRSPRPQDAADTGLRYTLPAWVYRNEEFHELEKEHLLLPGWQIVCHVSEIAKAGDYVSFDFLGQRGFVVRDDSGAVRAFHNVCSHRAHAVVAGDRGHCNKFLTCMYHGWTYHLDGRNRSVSAPDTFPRFDRSKFGLKPIELEVYQGMVFVRFRTGGASVAALMQPYHAELEHYRMEQMVPLDELWVHDLEIDWKNVVENYVEDYHFPIGHPGLSALMEPQYDREVRPEGTMRLSHRMREKPLASSWSAVRYAAFLPTIEHLPEDMRRRWTYFGLFPERVLRHLPRVAGFLPRRADRAGTRADPGTLLRIPRRPARDARGAVPVRAAQCAGSGGGRDPDALRPAGARLGRLRAGHPLGQGSGARRIPGLDPRADPGRAACAGAAARYRRREGCGAQIIRGRRSFCRPGQACIEETSDCADRVVGHPDIRLLVGDVVYARVERQTIVQRVACVEIMDFVRRELEVLRFPDVRLACQRLR